MKTIIVIQVKMHYIFEFVNAKAFLRNNSYQPRKEILGQKTQLFVSYIIMNKKSINKKKPNASAEKKQTRT